MMTTQPKATIWNYEVIVSHLPDILDHFHIDYSKSSRRISLACPIHEGSKKDGCTIYISGQKFVGNWTCFTNHCEKEHGGKVLDFIQAILNKNGITENSRTWLARFIGEELTQEVDSSYFNKKESTNIADILSKTSPPQIGVSRQYIRSSLIIPAKYYLERGYTRSVLDRYDVGLCITKGKQMSNRIVVPVYDDIGNTMIGCVGRTIKPQCLLCKRYHYDYETCPETSLEQYCASKWINSKGFLAEQYLYNLWNVKDFVHEWNSVVLVEGKGDVWRLEEAGIPIGLGTFGAKLSDGQLIKLQSLPITNIIVAGDDDEAGQRANNTITERLARFYNVIRVRPTAKDVGEMTITQVKDLFLPVLEKFKCHI